MATDKVIIAIELDDGSIKKGFATIEKTGVSAGKQVGKGLEKGTRDGIKQGGESGAAFLKKSLLGVAAAIGGAALFKNAISSAIRTEQISTQLKILTGSAQTAAGVLKGLEDFSAGTPFQFEDIARSANSLLSFGISAGEVQEKLRLIGEAAAGSNSNISDIATIFGQISAEGKLTGDRFNQLTDRAINLGPAIQKALGDSTTSAKDLIASGRVTRDVFEKAFRSMTEEGGIFAGALLAQSKTVGGALSNLSDNFGLLQTEIGKLFGPIIISGANILIGAFQSLRKLIIENADAVKGALNIAFQSFVSISSIFSGVLNAVGGDLLNLIGLFVAFKGAVAIQGVLGIALASFTKLRAGLIATRLAVTQNVQAFGVLRSGVGTMSALNSVLSLSFTKLRTALNVARIGTKLFQATLTLGLSFAFTEILGFVIETKEKLGGWGKTLQFILLQARKGFLFLAQIVLQSVNTIAEKLSSFENLPFGIGDKFKGLAQTVSTANEQIRVELTNTDAEIKKLRQTSTVSADEIVEANLKIAESTKQVTAAVKDQAAEKAAADLLQLRGSLGGEENELIVLKDKIAKEEAILAEAFERKLINDTERSLLLNESIRQGEEEKSRIMDEAFLKQEVTTGNFFSGFGNALQASGRQAKLTFGQIANQAKNTLARGVGTAFSAVGKALAKGQSGFDAFKSALKGILGEIASATGDLFIKQGIGYLFINPGLGAGLIAAGAGLKILSGALSSGGGGGGAAAGGGADTGSGFTANDSFTSPEIEREEQKPSVFLTVQGDILDSRDTGTRLLNILQTSLEDEGVSLEQGQFA